MIEKSIMQQEEKHGEKQRRERREGSKRMREFITPLNTIIRAIEQSISRFSPANVSRGQRSPGSERRHQSYQENYGGRGGSLIRVAPVSESHLLLCPSTGRLNSTQNTMES